MEDKKKIFALRIKHAMNIKHLRNRDVVARSRRLGVIVSASTVSHYLSGRFEPTDERVEFMAKLLGVDKEWLRGQGTLNDYTGKLSEKELADASKRLVKQFSRLRPDLQKFLLNFMSVLVEVSDMDVFAGEIIKEENYYDYRKVMRRRKNRVNEEVELDRNLKVKIKREK